MNFYQNDFNEVFENAKHSNSIIIGENGVGKSAALASFCKKGVDSYSHVIAIATSPYDKFPRRNFRKNYHYKGSRLGRFIPREAIKLALINLKDEPKKFSVIFSVLDYINFDQAIGIGLKAFKANFKELIELDESLSSKQKEELIADLSILIYDEFNFSNNDSLARNEFPLHDLVWIDTNSRFFLHNELLIKLIAKEKLLKKLGVLEKVDFYLRKKNSYDVIEIMSASSGELTFLASMIFIASFIEEEALILIDEPENSLHPQWQKEYISKVMDLFYFYSPSIIVSTHSPLIILGRNSEELQIYKKDSEGLNLISREKSSIEDLYDEMFDVLTPRNRSLSDKCAQILNNYSELNISYEEAIQKVEYFENKTFEEKQQSFLNGVRDLLNKIRMRRDADAKI